MARAQPGTSKAPTTKIRARRSSLSALIAAPTWAKRVHCLLHRFRSHFKRLTCSPLCASSGLKHRLLHRHPFLVKRNQLLLGEKPLPIHAVIISYTLSLHFFGSNHSLIFLCYAPFRYTSQSSVQAPTPSSSHCSCRILYARVSRCHLSHKHRGLSAWSLNKG